jgi:hypothetical protein
MSKPTVRSWGNLKKVARYLQSHPRAIFVYPWAEVGEVQELIGFSDSDWAGCRASRRSTSGGLIALGGAVLRAWSNRQATVALSSGEAEFHSATKAAAELLGVQTLMHDLDWPVRLWLGVDASAAQAMANRRGIGRVRHLDVRYMWLQHLVKAGAITVRKVPGRGNPSDVLTKSQNATDAFSKLKLVGVELVGSQR